MASPTEPVRDGGAHRVSVNGKWLSQAVTGTQRYATEVASRLVARSPDRYVLRLPADAPVPDWAPAGLRVARSRWRGVAFEQVALPWAARHELLLSLGGPAPVLARRQVVTMHDAGVFRVPESYSRAFRTWYRFLYRTVAPRAAAVLTVSRFSASELAQVLDLPESRFVVAPNGADHVDDVDPVRPDLPFVDGSFVLCVGTPAAHKNLALPLAVLGTGPPALVVVGAVSAERVFGATAEGTEAAAPAAVVLGRISDREVAWLYRHADALVFPSRYEGFGLPVVEAQRLGCPVACSNAASLAEVAGDGAAYFDPDDPESLRAALESLAVDRAGWAARGRANAERFRWADTAAAVERVLDGADHR
jgi:glycosyltransferase involved in cell wall biosynthesis